MLKTMLRKWLLKGMEESELTELQNDYRGTGGRSFVWQGGGSARYGNSEKRFRQVTAESLEELSQTELSDLLIETDPTVSRIYNDFVTFATLDIELTCEDVRGQEILDEFRLLLKRNRNSLNSVLVRVFGSILAYGTYCFEITFDSLRAPTNIFVIHPDTLYFRSRSDGSGGTVWDLGQYDDEDNFHVLSPDRVFYDATNPLVDKVKGHSMIAPAFPSAIGATLMQKDLQDVIHNHAWVRKFIKINDLELRKEKVPEKVIKERIATIEGLIRSTDNFKDPALVPVFSGPVEFSQVQGAGSSGSGGMQFVDIVARFLDRQAIRGGSGVPTFLGSNEYTAESSAKSQGLRASVWMESFQSLVEEEMGRALSMSLQGVGITEPAVLSLKRVDVVERELEADIFMKMAEGIKDLVAGGMGLLEAVELYRVSTNTYIPRQLIDDIERGMTDAEPETVEETD